MAKEVGAVQNQPTEWSLKSGKSYPDPFNQVELDVLLTHSSGEEWRLPAYWSGNNEWRVRFAPPRRGTYSFRTVCSDEENRDLNGLEGRLKAKAYRGRNPLLKHGFIEVMKDQRHFQHADGTPFFWLGDTWWMGLCSRGER